jgi:membrane dipeptidase
MSTLIPIFDGHNDTLLRLHTATPEENDSFFASEHGHIDLQRARSGGFAGGFFAIFVPRDPALTYADDDDETKLPLPLELAYAQKRALAMAALLFRIEADSQGQVVVVRDADALEACLAKDQLSAILHFEGADPIDTEFNTLEVLYQAGLRSLGIVWSRANAFGTGVPFAFNNPPDIGPGLTDAGKELVKACNRLGIMLDLSHLNEAGFWDVARLSTAPLVATHSNVHAICPSPRNLTDKQLAAIRESRGVVGLNFHVGFLRPDGESNADTPLSVLVDHIEYLVERLGIDGVALGSDFDGARMPKDISDVSKLPNLLTALAERGYDDTALRKIAYQNWFSVLRRTWKG